MPATTASASSSAATAAGSAPLAPSTSGAGSGAPPATAVAAAAAGGDRVATWYSSSACAASSRRGTAAGRQAASACCCASACRTAANVGDDVRRAASALHQPWLGCDAGPRTAVCTAYTATSAAAHTAAPPSAPRSALSTQPATSSTPRSPAARPTSTTAAAPPPGAAARAANTAPAACAGARADTSADASADAPAALPHAAPASAATAADAARCAPAAPAGGCSDWPRARSTWKYCSTGAKASPVGSSRCMLCTSTASTVPPSAPALASGSTRTEYRLCRSAAASTTAGVRSENTSTYTTLPSASSVASAAPSPDTQLAGSPVEEASRYTSAASTPGAPAPCVSSLATASSAGRLATKLRTWSRCARRAHAVPAASSTARAPPSTSPPVMEAASADGSPASTMSAACRPSATNDGSAHVACTAPPPLLHPAAMADATASSRQCACAMTTPATRAAATPGKRYSVRMRLATVLPPVTVDVCEITVATPSGAGGGSEGGGRRHAVPRNTARERGAASNTVAACRTPSTSRSRYPPATVNATWCQPSAGRGKAERRRAAGRPTSNNLAAAADAAVRLSPSPPPPPPPLPPPSPLLPPLSSSSSSSVSWPPLGPPGSPCTVTLTSTCPLSVSARCSDWRAPRRRRRRERGSAAEWSPSSYVTTYVPSGLTPTITAGYHVTLAYRASTCVPGGRTAGSSVSAHWYSSVPARPPAAGTSPLATGGSHNHRPADRLALSRGSTTRRASASALPAATPAGTSAVGSAMARVTAGRAARRSCARSGCTGRPLTGPLSQSTSAHSRGRRCVSAAATR